MTQQKIAADKITKPIQLLAAWLVGLIFTNGTFLTAALQVENGTWERSALIVAAICNVPVFLLALFLLQTKFRAELQEDTFYSEYLSKKTATLIRIDKNAAQDTRIEEIERSLAKISLSVSSVRPEPQASNPDSSAPKLDWTDWAVALNKNHPRFLEVREALRQANIPLTAIFGDKVDKLPKKWIVALNYHLPVAHKALLLKAILPYGFDGFEFWEPQREAEENEDIYIGCYGTESYAPVTDELMKMLDKTVEAVDLNHYYRLRNQRNQHN